ncbi:hypothetical protein AOR04_14235 [Pseudoalteromonas sp. 1_2015MBL_MicDiv]|nr:hypothetical protein AOR04_14235 [Pseudoalteromonas sp. 1_2015MBL_MicDiv]
MKLSRRELGMKALLGFYMHLKGCKPLELRGSSYRNHLITNLAPRFNLPWIEQISIHKDQHGLATVQFNYC